VHWHERFGAWVLTRYDDVMAGLHDHARLSSARAERMQAVSGDDALEPLFHLAGKRMSFTDPPQHTRLRHLVSKAFTPHAVAALESHIQGLVDQFLDRVEGRGRMDVIADLAFPLPATVITELLGVPPADRERIKQWSDDFMFLLSSDPSSIPHAHYERAAQGAQNLTDYFRVIVAERRANPRTDLLTALEQAEEQGDKLSEDELFGTANILMVAGHETTTNLIGNGLLALLRHPDQLQRLRDDPALLPQAIEEMLRYDGSVQFVTRIARDDVSLRGKTIRVGQFVHRVLAAANRDPEHFPDPDRFDVTRATDKQLTFGNGIHICLGIALARLEGRVAFRTLLRRFPAMRLDAEAVEYRDNFNLRGLKALPVAFQ